MYVFFLIIHLIKITSFGFKLNHFTRQLFTVRREPSVRGKKEKVPE